MMYLLWRVLTGRHTKITLSFLIAGHTKFSCDWCFGLLKRKFKRTRVDSLGDMEDVVKDSARGNIAQLCGNERARRTQPQREWYLYNEIREFASPEKQDLVAPLPTVPKPSRGTTQFEEEDEELQAPAPKVAKKSHSSRQVTGRFTLTATTSTGQVGETPTGRKGVCDSCEKNRIISGLLHKTPVQTKIAHRVRNWSHLACILTSRLVVPPFRVGNAPVRYSFVLLRNTLTSLAVSTSTESSDQLGPEGILCYKL
ncbi:hypothetical protein RRG08_066358 [Elysia crispata]|uniref:PARP-type domain-containing protein n=1 Tax=Elysia crispata TaxID=231223 RepID=A0AAE1CUM6_9GAST|nr:hypothetical protein RRG08_066358 [Elysia crispata]